MLINLNIYVSADKINGENKSLQYGFEDFPQVETEHVIQLQKASITGKNMCSTPKLKGFFIFNHSFYNTFFNKIPI